MTRAVTFGSDRRQCDHSLPMGLLSIALRLSLETGGASSPLHHPKPVSLVSLALGALSRIVKKCNVLLEKEQDGGKGSFSTQRNSSRVPTFCAAWLQPVARQGMPLASSARDPERKADQTQFGCQTPGQPGGHRGTLTTRRVVTRYKNRIESRNLGDDRQHHRTYHLPDLCKK